MASPVRVATAYLACQSMRVLIQRVARAEVRVRDEQSSRVAGRIGRGLLLLVGFRVGETVADDQGLQWMADKVGGLRIFGDATDKMNLGLSEIGGGVLVVSQFTLYGDAVKGRRPSFIDAARPEEAEAALRAVSRSAPGARPRGRGR